jgi:hypothetical protein
MRARGTREAALFVAEQFGFDESRGSVFFVISGLAHDFRLASRRCGF